MSQSLFLEVKYDSKLAFDKVTAMVFGSIIRDKSVPIDAENFTATPSTNSVTLTWDSLTPAESADQNFWEIRYRPTGSSQDKIVKTINFQDTSYLVEDLNTGVEYTFELYFVGYDDLKSEGLTATAVPS